MCKILEDMRNEAAEKAAHEKTVKIALRMLGAGKYTYDEIAALTEMTVDEVKALDERSPA